MFPIQVCVDASKAFEPARSQPVIAYVRNPYVIIVSHYNAGNVPLAGHKKCHLSLDLVGYGGNLASQFVRNDLLGGYSAAIQILKSFLLAGLETGYLAIYLFYGLFPS
jgi:hypothetical protein